MLPLLTLLLVFLSVLFLAKFRRILEFQIDNLPLLILLAAGIHGIVMLPYVGFFAFISDWRYVFIYSLVFLSLGAGFELAQFLNRRLEPRTKNQPPAEWQTSAAMIVPAVLVLVAMAGSYLVGYYQSLGTLNPLSGIRLMFSGENSANQMWATSGAETWGASRGGGESGGVIGYISRWLGLVPLLLLALLGRRMLWVIGIPFLCIKLLTLTSVYSARTSIAVWAGVLLLYFNQHIRRFRLFEVLGLLLAAFVLMQVLHMARLGNLTLREVTNVSAVGEGFDQAVIDTFEPSGWCFRAYETLGHFDAKGVFNHFASYFGALIPRAVWPGKPYYAFEPDLTMAVTVKDISANNPVRTFTVVAEGLLVGGPIGVVIICISFACFASLVERYLSRFWEYTFVRYWWILTATIMFRTSLFTLFSTAFVLGIIPVVLVGYFVRRFALQHSPPRSPLPAHPGHG